MIKLKELKKKLKNAMFENITTETPKRKWERRLIGALTEEHRLKCLYFIKLHSN